MARGRCHSLTLLLFCGVLSASLGHADEPALVVRINGTSTAQELRAYLKEVTLD